VTARKKNIFLTGAPSSGKTTVIKKVIQGLERRARGFYTEEERSGGRRTGFVLKTLDGEKEYLAHETIRSPFRVRRYGVSVENLERIAVPAIKPREGSIIILDEIGKMECFSPAFRDAALEALDSPNTVVGTITLGGDDFIHGLRRRGDMEIIEVTPENRDALPGFILQRVMTLP
jgi:nucleoside-triphosphatase